MVVADGHLAHAISGSFDRRQGPPLSKAAYIAGALALQSRSGLDHGSISSQITEAPAGHRPAFGKAVHGEAARADLFGNGRKAAVLLTIGQEIFIDLIAHHHQLGVTAHQCGQCLKFGLCHHLAAGVAR